MPPESLDRRTGHRISDIAVNFTNDVNFTTRIRLTEAPATGIGACRRYRSISVSPPTRPNHFFLLRTATLNLRRNVPRFIDYIIDRVKGDHADEIGSVFKDQVYQVVRSDQQGYSSTTYFVTFADNSSVVIQFRAASRPLDPATVSSARARLGSLVPEIHLVKKIQNDSVLVYKMTRLEPFNKLAKTPEFIHLLPSIAANVHIRAAVDSDDQLVAIHRAHYRQLLDVLLSGTLDDLPLAISNDDVSPTNIIVNRGVSAGLVDWEYISHWPLGWDTPAIFWLMGDGRDDHYVLHDTAVQIAEAFWKAFGAQLPSAIRAQSTAIESAMRFGAALSASVGGRYNAGHLASLPVMLDYHIPPAFWLSE
ncbi:hypothetical protein BS47DRAFT_1394127 [Hydnum rufescens UP504]|uniref:Aminoglycoside phosphotransferase domain-containing protein n=1 Tax=Hydnum rufescens UP504 TaxID=1448309 RepID=A0A9P6DWA3_9AGAM|nr:hypothetical protein BS47DRAFT_1394127 [Hydnum rufescens UP504]